MQGIRKGSCRTSWLGQGGSLSCMELADQVQQATKDESCIATISCFRPSFCLSSDGTRRDYQFLAVREHVLG